MTQMPYKDSAWLGNALMAGAPPAMDWSRPDHGDHVTDGGWEPHDAGWSVDGKPFYHMPSVPQSDMHVLLNTAVGGYRSGNLDHSTPGFASLSG